MGWRRDGLTTTSLRYSPQMTCLQLLNCLICFAPTFWSFISSFPNGALNTDALGKVSNAVTLTWPQRGERTKGNCWIFPQQERDHPSPLPSSSPADSTLGTVLISVCLSKTKNEATWSHFSTSGCRRPQTVPSDLEGPPQTFAPTPPPLRKSIWEITRLVAFRLWQCHSEKKGENQLAQSAFWAKGEGIKSESGAWSKTRFNRTPRFWHCVSTPRCTLGRKWNNPRLFTLHAQQKQSTAFSI